MRARMSTWRWARVTVGGRTRSWVSPPQGRVLFSSGACLLAARALAVRMQMMVEQPLGGPRRRPAPLPLRLLLSLMARQRWRC
jgi:hypothetical protein